MKRKAFSLAAMAMTVLLAACGGKSQGEANTCQQQNTAM